MDATFKRYVDDPTTAETELHARSGQRVKVLGLTDPANRDEEVGAMWHVEFEDGYRAPAFEDELSHVPQNPSYYLTDDTLEPHCLEHTEPIDSRYGCRYCTKED